MRLCSLKNLSNVWWDLEHQSPFSYSLFEWMFPRMIFSQKLCPNRGPRNVVGIATGYGLDGPGIESRWGTRFSAPVQTGRGAHPASCTMGTRSFLGVKSGRDVTLTPHPLLLPWSWKSRTIPLLPLWAVRPVQNLSAWTRVHFMSKPVLGNVDIIPATASWRV